MRKLLKNKLFIIVVLLIVGLVFIRTSQQPHLTERAITTALGIDISEKGYLISVQTLKVSGSPSSSSGSASGTNNGYEVNYSDGKTVAEALNKIETDLGKKLSLSHCNVVIFSAEASKKESMPSLDYLVKCWQIPEQSIIVATDGTALDLLRNVPASGTNTAFQIQQAVTGLTKSLQVTGTRLKDLLGDFSSLSRFSAVTMVKSTEVDGTDVYPPPESGSKIYDFTYTDTLAFDGRGNTIVLDPTETVALGLVLGKEVKKGGIKLTDGGTDYYFLVQSVKSSWKCKADGEASANVKSDVKLRLIDVSPLEESTRMEDIDQQLLASLSEKMSAELKESVLKLYSKLKESDFDVFRINTKMYSRCGKKWLDSLDGGSAMEKVSFGVEIKTEIALS